MPKESLSTLRPALRLQHQLAASFYNLLIASEQVTQSTEKVWEIQE